MTETETTALAGQAGQAEALGHVPLDMGVSLREHGSRPCHCLCSVAHPGEWLCRMLDATTTREFGPAGAPRKVPMCEPCARARDKRTAVTP